MTLLLSLFRGEVWFQETCMGTELVEGLRSKD